MIAEASKQARETLMDKKPVMETSLPHSAEGGVPAQ